jgi:cell division transport system ATP-binding protein
MIDLRDVSVVYRNERKALSSVSLRVSAGEFVFLIGSTGAGKSTLLKLLYHEDMPFTGTVLVGGHDVANLRPREVPRFRRAMGVVFQDFGLLPTKTVFENVAFALQVIGASRREIRKKVPAALELVSLAKRCDSYPHQISGGEQQRLAIARALVNEPPLLIADEPTGNLDPETSLGIGAILDEIHRSGTTVIVATHDKIVVDALCKRVVELDRGTITRDEPQGSYESAP